jgi:dipeptidyl aminopeptidase/acylaminoacyl peptidase
MSLIRWIIAPFVILAATADGQRIGQGQANGSLVAQAPCRFSSFEEQSAFTKRFYSNNDLEAVKNNRDTECFRIKYVSDGLKVIGYLVRPRNTVGKRYPVIIYNRGGFLDIGKIDTWNLVDFYRLSSAGFVILASQYRGNDGGEGREELGGADLDDVSNLFSVAKALPYVDMNNVFMYGLSRGGMMTFLALKHGAAVNAAAVVGAVFDLEAFGERAPEVVARVATLIPDYGSRGAATLKDRSVMNWPDSINVPLLIMHGADDEEVPASEALAFAARLSHLKKTYELTVYANDIHEVANNRRDRDARIVAWFKRYLR